MGGMLSAFAASQLTRGPLARLVPQGLADSSQRPTLN
jgi:hypothetical protein